jgi:hypothetical protein
MVWLGQESGSDLPRGAFINSYINLILVTDASAFLIKTPSLSSSSEI